MSSFLEKLKKGMGVENLQEENSEEKMETKGKAEEKPKSKKIKKKRESEAVKKTKNEEVREPRKLKIETKEAEAETGKTEKSKEEMKEEVRETEKEQKQEIETKKEKWPEPEGELTVDVYQTNGELVIQTAVAGVKPEDLDISIESDTVLIKGKRGKPPEKEEINYFYQECWWGPFSRQIILPEEADPSRAQAGIKEGILTIRIPKIERNKKKKIEVKG